MQISSLSRTYYREIVSRVGRKERLILRIQISDESMLISNYLTTRVYYTREEYTIFNKFNVKEILANGLILTHYYTYRN